MTIKGPHPHYESLAAFIARVLMFFGGLLILYWQNVRGGPSDLALVAAAIGMMGPLTTGVAIDASRILRRNGNGNGK